MQKVRLIDARIKLGIVLEAVLIDSSINILGFQVFQLFVAIRVLGGDASGALVGVTIWAVCWSVENKAIL